MAEQDTLGSHFSLDKSQVESVKDAALNQASKLDSGKFGPGAEQDRLESHFGLDEEQVQRMKDEATKQLNKLGGSGAEQDRHESHFQVPSDKIEKMKSMAERKLDEMGSGAEQDAYGGHFGGLDGDALKQAVQDSLQKADRGLGGASPTSGLGADGQARMIKLAAAQGVGAEQDRYAAHFGLSEDTIDKAACRVAEGGEEVEKATGSTS